MECPHCRQPLLKWRPPDEADWRCEFHWVCFNDDCSYYRRGWGWMLERYNVKASYRHRVNPATGHASPLPTWSPTAHRDAIVKDVEVS